MFEKEAEKYVKVFTDRSHILSNDKLMQLQLREAFKNGATFGYNKANEWHYPAKGELPTCDEKTQLMFYVNCYYKLGDKTKTIKRIVLGYYRNAFLRDDEKVFVEKSRGYEDEHLPQAVIAWKEIVLPKELAKLKEWE